MPGLSRHPHKAWILDPSYRLPSWGQRIATRFCFVTAVALAAVLGLLLIAAPWLPATGSLDLANRIVLLFAEDSIVRRSAVVSALGLWVTAAVFFRDPRRFPFHRRRATD
jgi:hypothetical protein